MIDIHSHILPGLDDGPEIIADSLAMLKIAAESGTTDIVATPHADLNYTFMPDLIERRISELQAARSTPRIHRGCDFHLTLENIEDALLHPSKYAINGKRHLLVEFSNTLIPKTIDHILDHLRASGLIPVITHPERNCILNSRIDLLHSWVQSGCLVQITAQSLLGHFGSVAKGVAIRLLHRNLVHFVASDAHDTKYRPPVLAYAYAYVAKRWGEKRAQDVFVTAPRATL